MSDEQTKPQWLPDPRRIAEANLTALQKQLKLPDYPSLHRWSAQNRQQYWELVIRRLGILFRQPYRQLLDNSVPTCPQWLTGAQLNVVESCFQADENAPAIVYPDRDGSLGIVRYGELRTLANRVSNGLLERKIGPGDAVAIAMPMTPQSVAIYLGIVQLGAAVVSIADSFAPEEIATRLRIGAAKLVFTQDCVIRGSKRLPLYEKVQAAKALPAVVLPADQTSTLSLRLGDQNWKTFLSDDDRFLPIAGMPHDPINILFSSGTTGDPKAIPWDHTTPIKCAADAHFHHDLHPGDIACWPTNLGWMMGPWLIFASLLNRCAMALYNDAPADAGFGRFVQDAQVNLLGVVPSLVRSWRQSKCMEGLDWTRINAFSSTGECSNPGDMRYLMDLAGGRPIIEYCGGTEIGGGYITGTVVQPCVPATFTTPAMGIDFVVLDENEHESDKGEVFLVGPSIGLSTRLLNRDHEEVYFRNTPLGPDGEPLRRHGDDVEKLPNGCWRITGRSDDTMNLGGIKVGCAEIERVLNTLPGVQETAAIAVSPPDGGPSQLVLFVVQRDGSRASIEELKAAMQLAIREHLNPLFKVHEIRPIAALPRTASNKVMRRELRAQYHAKNPA